MQAKTAKAFLLFCLVLTESAVAEVSRCELNFNQGSGLTYHQAIFDPAFRLVSLAKQYWIIGGDHQFEVKIEFVNPISTGAKKVLETELREFVDNDMNQALDFDDNQSTVVFKVTSNDLKSLHSRLQQSTLLSSFLRISIFQPEITSNNPDLVLVPRLTNVRSLSSEIDYGRISFHAGSPPPTHSLGNISKFEFSYIKNVRGTPKPIQQFAYLPNGARILHSFPAKYGMVIQEAAAEAVAKSLIKNLKGRNPLFKSRIADTVTVEVDGIKTAKSADIPLIVKIRVTHWFKYSNGLPAAMVTDLIEIKTGNFALLKTPAFF